MPDAVLPLQDLTQQISQHQSELERLRQEYEARQAQLAELARRKDELRGQLKQVEAQIQAVKQGTPAEQAAASAPPTPSQPGKPLKLPGLLVEMVQAAGRPITVAELAADLVRRKFPTTSGNLPRMVATRIKELTDMGILRRAPGQPGVLPGKKRRGQESSGSKPEGDHQPPRATAKQGTTAKKRSAKVKSGSRTGQQPLSTVLELLLRKSRRPVPARELATQALAGGYQTKSKNLTDAVWVALGRMENVENVPGKGYRLKQR